MFYPNAFQTGKVLDKGETEVGFHLPLSVTIAHGFSKSGLELRGIAGVTGFNTNGAGIAISKAISKGDYLFTSGTVDAEYSFEGDHNFKCFRTTGTYAIGYYFTDLFGIFIPLKAGYLFYDLNGEKGNGFTLIPGLGITIENKIGGKTAIMRIGGNFPIPDVIDEDVVQLPYIAIQALVRW